MRILSALGAFLLVLAASPALANGNAHCQLAAHAAAGGAQTVYDPFAPLNTVIELEIVVENAGDRACNGRLYVGARSGELALTSATGRLLYRIEGPRGGGATIPNGYGPFVVHVPAGGSASASIRFTVLAQQVVPKGDYVSDLVLAGTAEGNQPIDFAGDTALLRVAVAPRVEMSISGTAAPNLSSSSLRPASIDFGVARTGAQGQVFVNVWSNGPVTISLDSANRGVLRHVENPALPPISYRASFDGHPIDLAAVYSASRTPPLSVIGASYRLGVTLGDVRGRFAGHYEDIVTVNVVQN